MHYHAPITAHDGSHVADAVLFIAPPTAGQFETYVAQFARRAHDGFQHHGLCIHICLDKTDVSLKWVGQGAAEARAKVPTVQESSIPLREGLSLPVVRQYKHMGCVHDVRNSLVPEAAQRCKGVQVILGGIQGRVLAEKALQLEVRVQMAWSLVFSRLCYNTGVWAHNYQHACARLRVQYIRTLRAVVLGKFDPSHHYTDQQVLTEAKLPDVGMVASMCRVRVFVRVV